MDVSVLIAVRFAHMVERGWRRGGAGNGAVGRQTIVSGASISRSSRRRAAWNPRAAASAVSSTRMPRRKLSAISKAKRGLLRSIQSPKVSQASRPWIARWCANQSASGTLAETGRSLGAANQRGNPFDRRTQRRGGRRLSNGEGIGCNNQMPRLRRTAKLRAEQDLSHAGEEIGLPREPSHGVEARRLSNHACERQASMAGADAEDAAEACRDAHGPAGIRPDREIDEAPGHRRSRSAG